MSSPLISVIMSVYNGAEHLEECVESILAQSFTNFEFIIVDDASCDRTPNILCQYARQSSRLHILTNVLNIERSQSRNRAIQAASASLVAVMDADDWAHPERLALQHEFMQAHPEVTVCGTWVEIYETGKLWPWPVQNMGMRSELLFNSCMAHPTVIFRKDTVMSLTGGYTPQLSTAEDYDLWVRLAAHDEVVFGNIPTPLLRYRTHPEKHRSGYQADLRDSAQEIRMRQVCSLGLNPRERESNYHRALAEMIPRRSFRDLWACRQWGKILLSANEHAHVYNSAALRKVTQKVWRQLWWRSLRIWLTVLWVTYVPECFRKYYRVLKKKFFRR